MTPAGQDVEAVAVAAAPAGSAGWSRLHPLSPLLRSGRFVLGVVAVVGQQGLRDASLRTLLVGGAVALPLGGLVGLLSWLTTRYRLTATELQVDSGVVRRRSRRVPLARLQSVDVVRSLAARVLGLAELRLEVAGGTHTEAPLAHLSEDDAQRLRRRLLARAGLAAAGAGPGDPAEEAEPEETVLVQVPTGVLVASALLSGPTLLAGLLLLAVVVLLAVRPQAVLPVLAALLPALLAAAGTLRRRLLDEYGFTVAQSPDGLRLRHGLLQTRAQTIPEGRVQTVRVVEPLLWRRHGWVRVEVDVAGYAARGGEQRQTTSALLPVAPRALALALVARVLGAELPLAGDPVPRRARWRAPLSARRLALGLDDRHVVTTSGVLRTTTDVVPLRKVQSLRLVQGPWQRRLGLASVHVDSAGRHLRGAVARHRDRAAAAALLDDLTARARRARRR